METRNYFQSRYSRKKNVPILALMKKASTWYTHIKLIIVGVALISFVVPIIIDVAKMHIEGSMVTYKTGVSMPDNWIEELDRQLYYFLSSFSSFNNLTHSSSFWIEFSLRTLCHALVFCALATSICSIAFLLYTLLRPRFIIRSMAYETEETEAWYRIAQQDKGVNKLVFKNKNISAIIGNIDKTLISLFSEYTQRVKNAEDSEEKVLLRGEKHDLVITYEILVRTLQDERYLLWYWLGVKPGCETSFTPSKRSIFIKAQNAVAKRLQREDACETNELLHDLVSEYMEHSFMIDLYEIEQFAKSLNDSEANQYAAKVLGKHGIQA